MEDLFEPRDHKELSKPTYELPGLDTDLNYRIHGDNIVECDRALILISEAFEAKITPVTEFAPYLPLYEIETQEGLRISFELVPGYGRWGQSLDLALRAGGAPLRERADFVLTRLLDNWRRERIVFAAEFCSALPAGNQAWQRNGRALSYALAGVPYLYIAELGGVELDGTRNVKAARYPNPIVPFSYLAATETLGVICLPVYLPGPSSPPDVYTTFDKAFGEVPGRLLVKGLVESDLRLGPEPDGQRDLLQAMLADAPDISELINDLTQRGNQVTKILAASRHRDDVLTGEEWDELLVNNTPVGKDDFLSRLGRGWAKKVSAKVNTSDSFHKLFPLFDEAGVISVGADTIPISLVPRASRAPLSQKLGAHYGAALSKDFISWISETDTPLVVVWVNGFKPRGDDARPDRGLPPLARMLFGGKADILTIIFGPATPAMWKRLRRSPDEAAQTNGLLEAIVNLSDAVLVDSATSKAGPFDILVPKELAPNLDPIEFDASASRPETFSEQDVDTLLHLVFMGGEEQGVYECMCNPPGGDWSGVSLADFERQIEYRWTSLPRVSAEGGKRPDHIIQFVLGDGEICLVAIESKDRVSDLTSGIGDRLIRYVSDLTSTPPTTHKKQGSWQLWTSNEAPIEADRYLSGGAFCWTGEEDMRQALERGGLDLVLAAEFIHSEKRALLHVLVRPAAEFLLSILPDLIDRTTGRLEIEIH